MSTVTQQWADFLTSFKYEGLPTDVLDQVKIHILDSIGCCLGAFGVEWGEKVVNVGRDLGGKPESTVIGSAGKLHCAAAAYVNGKLSNVLDMDETMYQTRHVGGVPFFTALALGERTGASGRDVILATVLAYDLAARSALCGSIWRPDPEKGVVSSVYGSSAFNTLAAAASAGLMLKFTPELMINALGVSAFLAPGAIESKFSFTPPANFHKSGDMGWFCHGGIVAALCAQNGYVGDPSILDGPRGLAGMLGSLDFDYDTFTADLGKRWYIMDAGFKPYPTCRWFHNATGLMEKIVREHGLKPEDIQHINVKTHPLGVTLPTYAAADRWWESEGKELWFSQFSLSYALACTVHGITPGPAWAKEETLRSKEIEDMTRKVVHTEHPDAVRMTATYTGHPGRLFAGPPVSMEVISSKGRFTLESTDIPGDTWNPRARLTHEAITDKFRVNAGYALDSRKVDGIIQVVSDFDKVTRLDELTDLLTP